MKTLTLRLGEPELLKELEAIKKMMNIKTDSGAIKNLIKTYRENNKLANKLKNENEDMKYKLECNEEDREEFKAVFKNMMR